MTSPAVITLVVSPADREITPGLGTTKSTPTLGVCREGDRWLVLKPAAQEMLERRNKQIK